MRTIRWLAAAALTLAAAGEAAAAVPAGFPAGTVNRAAGEAVAALPAGFPAGAANRFAPAGDRVLLWDHEGPALSIREPDGTVRELHRAARRRGIASVIEEVAATPSQVAFITEGFRRSGDGGSAWTSLRAGPLGGPYRLVAGRERAGGRVEPRDVAFSDAGLLFSDGRGVVLRPADGSAPMRLGGTGGERIAANGRYAATRTSTLVTVYDLHARTVVTRLGVEADPTSVVPPSAAVSAGGTVAFVDGERRLWAYVPSTRERTLLMGGADAVAGVAGSTVFAVRQSRDAALRRLWAVDLRGGDRRPVSEAVLGGDFVTDGERLLYSRGRCVFHGDLVAPEKAPVTAECPRQPFHFFAAERQRRPAVPMRVTCPGASADRCTGTAELTAPRAGGGRVALGTWRFDTPGGSRVTHALKVRLRGTASRVTARLRITGSPFGRATHRVIFDLPRRP